MTLSDLQSVKAPFKVRSVHSRRETAVITGMKTLLTLLLILAAVLTVAAQKQPLKPCTLTLEQAPEVRGLKLGQRPGLLAGFFPDSYSGGIREFKDDIKPDEVGLYRKLITNRRLEPPDNLKGVSFIRLSYLDESLASIEITYSSDVKWQSASHFASAIAEQLRLPTDGWVDRIGNPRLECQAFFIEATNSLGGRLLIERTNLRREISTRRAVYEQKKRVEFKP